ncbi:MAG TPA: HPr family phosphocarrier protein [Puia sp.]|jgi:phosphocarrier protein HPr|nr:HPr family phosphocarrier protein [Puia sp.]
MITKEYLILAPEGMHARPATAMVRLAKQFQAVIHLKKGEKAAKLNSLLNILSMGIKGGEAVVLEFEGADEAAAAGAFDAFFADHLKDW